MIVLVLIMIRALDHPFEGLVRIGPDDFIRADEADDELFAGGTEAERSKPASQALQKAGCCRIVRARCVRK